MFGTTFWLLTELSRPERMMTFSSHSMSLRMLIDVDFWQKDIETGVERGLYLKPLEQMLKIGQIILITGARRSGKSFLIK